MKTFEQWRTTERETFDVFLSAAGGDVAFVLRSYRIAEKRMAAWAALVDLCGPQAFIDKAIASGSSVAPWHLALAYALGRAAPNKGKVK